MCQSLAWKGRKPDFSELSGRSGKREQPVAFLKQIRGRQQRRHAGQLIRLATECPERRVRARPIRGVTCRATLAIKQPPRRLHAAGEIAGAAAMNAMPSTASGRLNVRNIPRKLRGRNARIVRIHRSS